MEKNLVTLLCAAVGLFALAGAIKDWDWFMNDRKAKMMTALLGRKGARVFYGLIGLILVGMAIAFFTDSIPLRAAR